MVTIRLSAVVLALSMLALAACGDDDPSPEEAMADLCTDLTELQSSVQNLAQVSTNPNATVDQLEDARDEVNEQMDAVESAAEDVDQAEVRAGESDEAFSECLRIKYRDNPSERTLTRSSQEEIDGECPVR